jgi:hypothetical protein
MNRIDQLAGDLDAEHASTERALERARHAELQLQELEAAFERRRGELERLELTLGQAEAALVNEQHARAVERSHQIDTFESLRTRIVRGLDRQLELLTDGLHALRNGSPEVTEEFIERSIAAIESDAAQLRDAGGTSQ